MDLGDKGGDERERERVASLLPSGDSTKKQRKEKKERKKRKERGRPPSDGIGPVVDGWPCGHGRGSAAALGHQLLPLVQVNQGLKQRRDIEPRLGSAQSARLGQNFWPQIGSSLIKEK